MTEREFAISVVRRLREAGHEALWAGGCVRDELLGRTPKDYDVASAARPEEVRRLFRRTIAVGAAFGVVEVLGPRESDDAPFLKVQVATFRSDVSYSDGRHPDSVVFSSAREDALRRDFTINGMFFDPLENQLIDHVGGQDDLRARVLRAIGDPTERFREDKLRILRAVRLAPRFELSIEPATLTAMRAMAPQISVVSAERIAEELRQLIAHPRRAVGMTLLDEAGLVGPLLPELLPMKGLPQGPPSAPTGDLWAHTLRVMELLEQGTGNREQGTGEREQKTGKEEPSSLFPVPCSLFPVSFPLAFAALLHDVGKPRSVGRAPDRYTFHGHEHIGRRMASVICQRLKLANVERERIEWLVEKHQFLCDVRQMRTSKLKTTLNEPGIHELLALHRADARASNRSTDHVDYCEFLLSEWSAADLNPPPLLTGHDLTRHGLEPGPLFKRLLDAVREAQLEGTITTPGQALELVDRLREQGKNS